MRCACVGEVGEGSQRQKEDLGRAQEEVLGRNLPLRSSGFRLSISFRYERRKSECDRTVRARLVLIRLTIDLATGSR